MNSPDQIPLPEQLFYLVNNFEKKPDDEIKQKITGLIRELINNKFTSLVELLYRIVIDEKKLKEILKSHPHGDSASIIADLIISRQRQKTTTRNQFANRNKPRGDDSW
jgi:hypothetical protein